MERDWDRRFDSRDRPMSGETYRPSQRIGRPFPPRDVFRSNRSPSVRNRSPPAGDSYVPPGSIRDGTRSRGRSPGHFHRESHTSHFRNKDVGGSWRERPRSPPRRWSPRRDLNRWEGRQRSPSRGGLVRARSPYNGSAGRSPRGPSLKRARERSPTDDRAFRSPPPPKRERFASPLRGRPDRPLSPVRRPYSPARKARYSPYLDSRPNRRSLSRSPIPREERLDIQGGDSWRRRSPSPIHRNTRFEYRSEHSSGRDSTSTSRRSSPPIHPSRRALQQPSVLENRSSTVWSATARPPHPSQFPPRSPRPRTPRRSRSPMREGSLPPRRRRSPHARSPPRGPAGYRSPPGGNESPGANEGAMPPYTLSPERKAPLDTTGPSHQNVNLLGPGSPQDASINAARDTVFPGKRSPPSGPSAPSSAPFPVSVHGRLNKISVLSAPSHPRGGSNARFIRDGPRESYFSPTYPASRRQPHLSGFPRGGHRNVPGPYGPRSRSPGHPPPGHPPPGVVPTGPRSSHGPSASPYAQSQPYRHSHHTTSTTYPRTQHFTHHLSGVPALVPGGKLLSSSLKPEVVEKLSKLEEERKRLMDQIDDKMTKKRTHLRDWERLERESAREGLKSDLAEQQLRIMTDEGGLGGSAF